MQHDNNLHQAIGNAFADAKRKVLRASRQGTDLREIVTYQTTDLSRRLHAIADGQPEPKSVATPAAHAAINLVTSAVDRELIAFVERVHAGESPVDSYRQLEAAIHSEVPAACFLGFEAAQSSEAYTRSDLNDMQIGQVAAIANNLGIGTNALKVALIDAIMECCNSDDPTIAEKGGAQ